jgi:hypothetical protein
MNPTTSTLYSGSTSNELIEWDTQLNITRSIVYSQTAGTEETPFPFFFLTESEYIMFDKRRQGRDSGQIGLKQQHDDDEKGGS